MNYVIIYAQKRAQSYAWRLHNISELNTAYKMFILATKTHYIRWIVNISIYMNYVIIYAQKRAQSYAWIFTNMTAQYF